MLEVVVDLVRAAAEAPHGDGVAVDAVLDVLREPLDASFAIVSRVDLRTGTTWEAGRDTSHGRGEAVAALVPPDATSDPLLGALVGGFRQPSTAQSTLGRQAWRAGPVFDVARGALGVTQVANLPLHGDADRVSSVLLGRRGRDFTRGQLDTLAAVQPVMTALDAMLTRTATPPAAGAPVLTRREHEVLVLLSQGHTAASIGRTLGCSVRTVHRHLAHVYAKLDVGDRLLAVQRARDLGMLGGAAG